MAPSYEERLNNLAVKLFEINAFKFGDYKMKSGMNSPIYFDLRVIISHPDVMTVLSNLLIEFIANKKIVCKHVCGVPYTALPIATLVSAECSVPMLIRRKEAKSYGTKKLIEGKFSDGDTCLIIEDVVTSGSSIMETVMDLRSEGICVNDAIVVVNREQGGGQIIETEGVRLHSLFKLSNLLKTLQEAGKIEEATVKAVGAFIAGSQIENKSLKVSVRTTMSFEEREPLATCSIAKKLFTIMVTKKTNLCVAADLTNSTDILNLANTIGPYICCLKTHIDIVDDFSDNFINSLVSVAAKHNFLLLEDRKFADIGNTVALQYANGPFAIARWAQLVTAHTLPGQSIIDGLKSAAPHGEDRGVFLLAELSCENNLITAEYTARSVALANAAIDTKFVAGIVCQDGELIHQPGLIQLTPGVRIDETGDALGQQYNTPEFVVGEKGADVAVVGRGILQAKDKAEAAIMYRDRLWAAYTQRLAKADV